MADVEIADRETGGVRFAGTEVARVNTRYGPPGMTNPDPRPRWGENVVWRLDSNDGYVLLRGAYSVIYHRPDTRCRIRGGRMPGDPATVDDLPDDAEPCPVCRPPYPDRLGDRETVRYEFPRQSIDRCPDPAAVAAQLVLVKIAEGVETSVMPEPAKYLLQLCAKADPAFRGVRLPMKQIA